MLSVIDAVAVCVSFWLVMPLPAGAPGVNRAWAVFTIASAVVTFCFVGALRGIGAYRPDQIVLSFAPLRDMLLGLAAVNALSALAALVLGGTGIGTFGAFLLWQVNLLGVLVLLRQLEGLLLRPILRRGVLDRRLVVVGATPTAAQILSRIGELDEIERYTVVGVYDVREPERRPADVAGYSLNGGVEELYNYALRNRIDLIIIAIPWHRVLQTFNVMERLQWVAADMVVPLDRAEFSLSFARVLRVAGTATLQISHRPVSDLAVFVKLAEDYLVAALALLVTAPIMLLAALAIRLESPGPVLFRQQRVGFNRQNFTCFKLRTMRYDPQDDGSAGTRRGDPRVTRVGRVLRRLSIDELPQLFNVLRGEMSIVGPRPHVPNMLVGAESYVQVVREYTGRYRVKPGITGWAQINGMRGFVDSVQKARRVVEMDIYYLENWSLWLDIKIILYTAAIGMVDRDSLSAR